MGLREEKKELQRSEILEVAITLFRKRGYDATRVQDIIERLRISEATFFNYFASKDEVLEEFALDQIEGYMTALRAEVAATDRGVPDRIKDLMRRLARAWSSDREFMSVVVTRSNLLRATGRLREKELRSYELLAELFRAGQARAEIRSDVDPLQLAELLTAMYTFTSVNWLTGWWGDVGESLDARLQRATGLFLESCSARQKRRGARSSQSTRRGAKSRK